MPKPKRLSRSKRRAMSGATPRRNDRGRPGQSPAAGRTTRVPPTRTGEKAAGTAVVGVVVRRGKNLEIDPAFQAGQSLLVAREGIKPRAGDLVLFAHAHGRRARITRVIGRREVLSDVLEALLVDRLPRRDFGSEVLAEAAEAASAEQTDDPGRVDLRDLFTFTVDPATARDFDDALSFRADGDLVTVFVHIADVVYYVPEGSLIDQEALRRTTSVYVPTGVVPMLPALLSAGVCSLQPGVERKAVTAEMTLDLEGVVRSVRFYRSLIVSDERLDYDQLQACFDGARAASPALAAALVLGRPLAKAVRGRREARGSLRITSFEPDFLWEGDALVGAHPSAESESHGFIEDYMVLANEQVATFLEKERVPTVFRVHDLPDPFALDRMLDVFASLDLPTPRFDPLTATSEDVRRTMVEAAGFVESSAPKNRGRQALDQQILRAQSRAVYRADNIGHFGLSLATYCHFTSPIRRYPDLLVHRGLLGRLGVAENPTTSTLPEWAEHCSVREREAKKIELLADDIALAYLLEKRLAELGPSARFEGQIVGFARSGAFVLFDRLYQGFLPARELPGDYYELDEAETAMVGRRTGAAYRLAELVDVRVTSIDGLSGKVDLSLALD